MNKWWAGSPNYNSGNNGRLYLFPHWTAGGFSGSVATLQNPARQASAHYVIEGDNVAQLVDEANTAWHCGNAWYNHRSIAYEMVGWPGHPPTRETLDTTAQLMADASRRYFGGARLVLGENVMLHKMVYPTSCPGESDIGYLIAKANEYLGQGGAPQAPSAPAQSGGEYHVHLQAKSRAGGVLPRVTDNEDDAGDGSPIEYLAAWATPGKLDVQAITRANGDLPVLSNPSNIADAEHGSVGDGSDMVGLRMYYWSPNSDKAIYYRVMVGGVWLPWMMDHTDLGGSSDTFAGDLTSPIQRVEAYIGDVR